MTVDLDLLECLLDDLDPDEALLLEAAIDEIDELRREVAKHRDGQLILFTDTVIRRRFEPTTRWVHPEETH